MGIAVTRPHPLTQTQVIKNAHPVVWEPHSKFQSGWSVGLAFNNQNFKWVWLWPAHTHVVNNSILSTCRPHANILPDCSLINFF